jgi:hypothetical protein
MSGSRETGWWDPHEERVHNWIMDLAMSGSPKTPNTHSASSSFAQIQDDWSVLKNTPITIHKGSILLRGYHNKVMF